MTELNTNSLKLQRQVEPKGHLLSDNDTGVDHLGYSVYADALAKLLFWVQTPITVGVFAPWGSGKSFLLREVRYLLQKYQNQKEIDHRYGDSEDSYGSKKRKRTGRSPRTTRHEERRQSCSCVGWTIFLLSLICLLIVTLFVALDPAAQHIYYENVPNSTASTPDETTEDPVKSEEASIGFLAVVVLLSAIGIVFITFVCCVSTTDSQCWAKTSRNFRLVAYASFTTLPTLGEKRRTAQADYDIVIDFDEDAELSLMDQNELLGLGPPNSRLQTKYIFVNFKAWEYAGSDTLWAGIVTNLTQAIETEFGAVTARLFRMLDIEEVLDESKCREPSSVRVRIHEVDVSARSVKRMMTQYGVVVGVERRGSWWTVEYSSSIEARNALKSLRIAGLDARLSSDTTSEPVTPTENARESSNCKSMPVSIEMENMVPDRDCTSISSRDIRWSANPRPTSFCSHFLKYPKKVCCGCPFLYFCILFFIALVLFPIGVCIIVSELRLDILRATRAIPVEVQILAWMPATAAALVVVVRFCYAMFKSQTRRVNQALSGAKGNMAAELGFMSKVKDEIKIIEKLVRCLRFTHQQNYKIIISIDDLDRCSHEKVKSVLEAVSILLSDRCSPFVCLIALDSRVAVKCIEEGMGKALLNANVNGHEYLKKIINLPFCLPELSSRDKRRYFAGMMDQSDRTKLVRKSPDRREVKPPVPAVTSFSAGDVIATVQKANTTVNAGGDAQLAAGNLRPASPVGTDSIDGSPASTKAERRREFLYKCRKFLHDDETIKYHLAGNPRNMKRIFNVISMTTHLIESLRAHEKRSALIQKWTANSREDVDVSADHDFSWRLAITTDDEGAKDLVLWVVLTDQWPYRMSYLLQVIDDADQRSISGRRNEDIPDEEKLRSIYEKIVIPEINASLNLDESTLLSLDGDSDLFLGLICSCSLTKRRALQLKGVTVNLDQSLRQNIALYRSLYDLQKTDATLKKQEGTGNTDSG